MPWPSGAGAMPAPPSAAAVGAAPAPVAGAGDELGGSGEEPWPAATAGV